ncbi:MAG TPA: DUF3293 domain-containing protein [Vicinamibacterales bacterium]|nr:DUF3293 domain-containing protein [Vicinamibacterales bacterium]
MDATYIDFEALQTEPGSPALLGILAVEGGKDHFEQVIVDSRLAPGRVASSHVRAATLADTVRHLLAGGRPLVSWSIFDRDVVEQSDLDASLKAEWRARHVNALTTARRWRTKVHPGFKITKADRRAAKHTLDQYAELAGYRQVAKLRGGEPARWIKHLREQLASRTHYRRVTKLTKRHWHALLDYNRHDLSALRHVYERATFELQKWREYENTDYFVFEPEGQPIRFRVGGRKPRLDALLARYGATRWAFMTAWNPASRELAAATNDSRQDEMLTELTARGYRCLRGEGRGADPSWPAEESVLVLDIPPAMARTIGRRFGQLAIVTGRRGASSKLVACL